MDAKALAKSKRAHSQHHSKKYHPNQKPKPPVDSGKANDARTGKKPLGSGKQLKEKAQPTHSASALPSNWDRYEEEFDLGSEDSSPSGAGPNHTLDVVLPKSKGADYRHLIAEAQSQPQLNAYSDAFPSLDDVLPGDWNMGMGSLLSARGESILSRIGDDNFVVEDKAAARNEVSFLSLNLHALAEQLEKIDLPQRLFIEADLFPPQMLALGLEAASCSRSSEQMQATIDQETAQRMPEESSSSDFSEKVLVSDHDHDIEIPISGFPDPTLPNLGSVSLSEAFIDPSRVSKSDYESKGAESETQFSVKSFEASSAEAELDMLLDSFSESNPNINEEASMAPIQIPTKLVTATNLDEELDDLINQTSIPMNSGSPQTHHHFQLPSSHPGPKSKQVDDFDSWLDTI